MEKINKNVLNQVIAQRDPQSYKGNYGKILIIAGSTQFGGAPFSVVALQSTVVLA